MDAVEFLKQFNRMCKAYNDDGCKECSAYKYRCGEEFDEQEEDGVSIVEKWAKEHPVKTRQSEFLKSWPEVTVDKHGVCNLEPCNLCPSMLNSDGCSMSNCDKCRRDFWLKEIE